MGLSRTVLAVFVEAADERKVAIAVATDRGLTHSTALLGSHEREFFDNLRISVVSSQNS
jgi:hypothetical protein